MLVNMGRPRVHDEGTAEALLDAAERIVAADGPDACASINATPMHAAIAM